MTMKIYKLAMPKMSRTTLQLFCEKNNIDIDSVNFLGGGDFGEAYGYQNKVIKITSDPNEYKIAKELVGYENKPIAKIFQVDKINGDYIILMEKVEQRNNIEDMYYEVERLAEEQDTDIENLDLDDLDDLDVSPELKDFAESLQWIYYFQRNLGLMQLDIKPENLGYNEKNELVCFDMTDHGGF